MNKKLLVVALLSTATISAMAQSKFDGFYGQVGIGYENVAPSTSTTLNYGGVNIPSSITLNNTGSFAGTATLGYSFAVNRDFLLGIGAEYSPIAGQKQNISYNLLGTSVTS